MKNKLLPKSPFLLIIYGYPGSGKTTFAKQLADDLSNTVHLNSDKIYSELSDKLGSQSVNSPALSSMVMNYIAKEFLDNNSSVIMDMPANKKSERRKLRNLALTSKAKPLTVWLQIDAVTAFDRTKKRDKRKTESKFANEYSKGEFESIISSSQNPIDEDYVVISGKHTYNTQKGAVIKKMYELKILSHEQSAHRMIKPELVNLIPQSFRGKDDLRKRNISIR